MIGSSVALELARSGRSVTVIDKGPAPGAGSTSSSSSIIRFSYSTLDAVLTAWEAAPAWEHWEQHLGVADPDGMCRFLRTGMLLFDSPDFSFTRITDLWDDVGIPYEVLETPEIAARFPQLDLGKYYPPKPVDDPAFADDPNGTLRALTEPDAGFVDDPMLAARNLLDSRRGRAMRAGGRRATAAPITWATPFSMPAIWTAPIFSPSHALTWHARRAGRRFARRCCG